MDDKPIFFCRPYEGGDIKYYTIEFDGQELELYAPITQHSLRSLEVELACGNFHYIKSGIKRTEMYDYDSKC